MTTAVAEKRRPLMGVGVRRAQDRARASVVCVPAADVTAFGRTARWLLLFCTLFGLATMHTLGHAGMRMHGHDVQAGMTHAAAAAPGGAGQVGSSKQVWTASPVQAMAAPCDDDHCNDGHGPGGMGAWSVCLAILGGLALVVLIGALLLSRRHDRAGPGDEAATARSVTRSPPGRHHGLRIASLTVLRI